MYYLLFVTKSKHPEEAHWIEFFVNSWSLSRLIPGADIPE
jgi:hypothetical protein